MLNNNQQAFFALVEAGLWEHDVRLLQFEKIDFSEVFRLAEEQSVVGLVAVGLEHVLDLRVPKGVALLFAGTTLQLEQRNIAMNSFIEKMINVLGKKGIESILVKGQGVAQCYAKPLWRACGDIDLLLDEENYKKAKILLSEHADSIENEDVNRLHLGIELNSFLIELHGSLRSLLSKRMDRMLDEILFEVLNQSQVRLWKNNETNVYLPAPLQDVIIIFTHILQHFFQSGIGIRQICDWCRLLWRYHDELDKKELESRILRMGVMNEWRVFSALAVDYLGMYKDFIPFYSSSEKWKRKARLILPFVLETGNFGHNRDMSYVRNRPLVIRKLISLNTSIKYSYKRFKVFPRESTIFFFKYFFSNVKELLS